MRDFCLKFLCILFLIKILGFPVIDAISLLVLFVLTISIVFSEIKTFKFRKNILFITSIPLFVITSQFLPQAKIEEGSNFILFKKGENPSLEKALPKEIYQKFKNDFQEIYEISEKRCKGSKVFTSGCWRDYDLRNTAYSFSMDSIYQDPKYSRIVNDINFYNVVSSRSGFLNGMKIDYNTNWYEWKSEGDPIKEKAPFFIYWEFPENLGGQLCIKGKYFLFDEQNKPKFHKNKTSRCLNIPDDKITKVLAFNISPIDKIEVKFNEPFLFLFFKLLKKIFAILICIIFVKTIFKIKYEPLVITIALSFLTFLIIDLSREFRAFFQHKHLYLGGGGDALTYWGFARHMMHSFLNGDILHSLSGSEDIFYYMPGYRYFLFFQSFIFGESQILGWLLIIITPSIIFFLSRKLTTDFNSYIITFLFTFLFIANFYRGVHMHGEVLAYPMALLSIIYTIKSIDEKNNISLKNRFIFYSSILMTIGILCRPNLLAPAFLIHAFLLFRNQNFKSLLSFVLGYSPLILMPLHNIIYGGKFVILTSSATIPNNMENSLTNWFVVFKDIFKGNLETENVTNFILYFGNYLSGPAVQPFYLLVPILIFLVLFRCFKSFKIKPFQILRNYLNEKFLIIYLFILGTHFVCWFFKPGGRYAYLAFILTFIIIILFVLDFLKQNVDTEYSIIKKIRYYFNNTFKKESKNTRDFFLSCGPIGYFPIASGTLCSFIFAFIGYTINYNYGWIYTFLLFVCILILGTYFCFKLDKNTSNKDPSWVVIDEAAGQLLVSSFAGLNPFIHFTGFLLFRFFDITKLSIIKRSEKIKFGFGIMADDFLAALISILILFCLSFFITF